MAFDIKRWPISEKAVKFAAIIVPFIAISVILYTIVVLVPPIKNSIEIQNGTFNYTSSATELQTAISAGNLLSSIVVAGATVIYVVFTYFILDATNKNTQQSSLSIQQTAKFQKIDYLERRLEKLYLPLKIVLDKSGFDKITSKEHSMFEYYLINQRSCEFIDDYKRLFSSTYLAPNHVKSLLDEFFEVLNSNPLLYKKLENVTVFTRYADGEKEAFSSDFYELIKEEGCGKKVEQDAETISKKYVLIKNLVESDIELLEAELAELVNP